MRFGLKQDWWYDGRRDVIESTRAALDYLQALHDQFDGDWLLAIAAYNVGENTVQREFDRNKALGKPTDFWHLKLPAETRAYVPKLLAMKRLMAEPERGQDAGNTLGWIVYTHPACIRSSCPSVSTRSPRSTSARGPIQSTSPRRSWPGIRLSILQA